MLCLCCCLKSICPIWQLFGAGTVFETICGLAGKRGREGTEPGVQPSGRSRLKSMDGTDLSACPALVCDSWVNLFSRAGCAMSLRCGNVT